MRLINKAELVEWLSNPTGFRANCEDCTSIDCLDCILEECIKDAPEVDAVKVVHGRWKSRKNWTRSVCSACSFENDEETRFCPNCGAKMDGKGERNV